MHAQEEMRRVKLACVPDRPDGITVSLRMMKGVLTSLPIGSINVQVDPVIVEAGMGSPFTESWSKAGKASSCTPDLWCTLFLARFVLRRPHPLLLIRRKIEFLILEKKWETKLGLRMGRHGNQVFHVSSFPQKTLAETLFCSNLIRLCTSCNCAFHFSVTVACPCTGSRV